LAGRDRAEPEGDSLLRGFVCSNRPDTTGAMEMDTAQLLWGLLFSSIGLGYFLYGKNQKALVPAVCGVVLMIYPYFVSSSPLLVAIGLALMAIPYFVRF